MYLRPVTNRLRCVISGFRLNLNDICSLLVFKQIKFIVPYGHSDLSVPSSNVSNPRRTKTRLSQSDNFRVLTVAAFGCECR